MWRCSSIDLAASSDTYTDRLRCRTHQLTACATKVTAHAVSHTTGGTRVAPDGSMSVSANALRPATSAHVEIGHAISRILID